MIDDKLRERLLACPFCGNSEITFYAVEDMLAADCRTCGAHGPIILDGKAVTKPSLAGEAWNTRAELTRNTAIAEQLADELEWLAVFADVRSKDDSKVFARVNRGALRTIRDRARQALATYRESVK